MRIVLVALALAAAPASAAEDTAAKILRDTYPLESLRLGEEGSVGMAMDVDSIGKIGSCRVTRTSGYARLDRAACDIMLVHVMRIPPAKGAKRGAAVRVGQIDWALPAGFARPAAPPPRSTDAELAAAAEKISCTVTARQGSLQIKQKICLSAADRQRSNDYTRRNQGVP